MLLKKPESITLLDIVKIIDGEGIFKNCIIDTGICKGPRNTKKLCPVHDDYEKVREELVNLFSSRTIAELVDKAGYPEKIIVGSSG